MPSLSFCLKAIGLHDDDLSALTDSIEDYQRAGVDPEAAKHMAIADVQAGLVADRKEMVAALREQHPDAFQAARPVAETIPITTRRSPAGASARARARMAFNPETDGVLQALAKMGGISRDVMEKEFGLRREELQHVVDVGNLRAYPFRKSGGMDLDRALTNLEEAGYFRGVPADEIRTKFEEMVYDEMGGNKNLTAEGQMRAAKEANDERLDEQETAERSGLLRDAEMHETGIDALGDDDIDFLGHSNVSTERAMRELGFSEQEIEDELRQEKAAGGGAEGASDAPGKAPAADEAGGQEARPPKPPAVGEEVKTYGGTVKEPDAPYATDLFGEPTRGTTDLFEHALPDETGKAPAARAEQPAVRGHAQPEPALRDTPAPPGDYYAPTTVGSEARRKVGVSSIRTPGDAAAATNYLRQSAVERFDGIVTDAAGRVLGIIGGFKGALTQAAVYPATLMGEAVRIPGAAKIWFSHNHPSGSAVLSRADMHLNEVLSKTFMGSGIEPRGLLAIGDGEFQHVSARGQEGGTRAIPATTGDASAPVIERKLGSGKSGPEITSPASAKDVAGAFYKQSGKPGMVMLDSQHRVVGWVPLPEVTKGVLRNTGGLNSLYRAVSEANAASVILVHGGELDARLAGDTNTISINVATALKDLDVRVLDSINAKTGKSAAQAGMPITSTEFLSIHDDAAPKTDLGSGAALARPDVSETAASPADAAAIAKIQSAFQRNEVFKDLKLTAMPQLERPGPDAAEPVRMRFAAADLAEKLFGKRVVFFDSNIQFANGVQADYLPHSIFINEATSRPIMAVIGHEMTHSLRQDHPEVYRQLSNRLGALLEEPGRYHEQLAKLRAKRGMEAISFDKIREELYADIVGDHFTHPQFWRDLAAGQPRGFGRVLRIVRDFFDGLLSKLRNERPYGTADYLNDMVGARKAVVDAMRAFANDPKTASAAVTRVAEGLADASPTPEPALQ